MNLTLGFNLGGLAFGGGTSAPPVISGTLLEFWAGNHQAWTLNGSKVASGPLGGSLGASFDQTTDALRPSLVLSAINGQPAVRFAAASAHRLPIGSIALPANIKIFAVIQTDGSLPGNARVFCQGATSQNNAALQLVTTNSARCIFGPSEASPVITASAAFGSDPTWILGENPSGVNASIQVNGGAPEIAASATDISTGSAAATIGARSGGLDPFDGDLAYLGIFTAAADLGPLVDWA